MAAQIGQANTAAANSAAQFGANAANNTSSQNAQAANQSAQFDAAQRQAAGLANAAAADTAARFGADSANAASAAGAQAENTRNLTQSQLDQQTALANADSALKAAQGNQSADLSAAGLRDNAAGMMGNLGQTLQALGLNDTNSLAAMGQIGQQTDQAALSAAYQEFLRQQQYPFQQAGMLSGVLGATPMLQNTSGTATQTQGVNPLQVIGTAAQMAAMAGMSDARLKTDVEPVSTDPKGRRWYAFRYLWDRPSVRRLGVMAQEILASDPHAVLTHPSGFLMVDYGALA
jgi:hypothetical protein